MPAVPMRQLTILVSQREPCRTLCRVRSHTLSSIHDRKWSSAYVHYRNQSVGLVILSFLPSAALTGLTPVDIPHSKIVKDPGLIEAAIPSLADAYIICRRGNDSLLDARIAKSHRSEDGRKDRIFDVRGGLQAWQALHPDFPLY